METGRPALRKLSLCWLGLFMLAGLTVAFLNRHHDIEQGIYLSHYVPMAEHFRSGAPRDPMTYPMWGYPLTLAALPDERLILPLQVTLSSVAMFALYVVMRRKLLAPRGLLEALFVAGWPWYTLHSVRWPMSPAVSLTVLSLVLLWLSMSKGRWWAAVAGGALAGAALNFRSDFLLLGVSVLVVIAATCRARRGCARDVARAAVYSAVALVCLAPWAFKYRAETGRFSLSSSHGGMVAYIALGQLPRNPWGIVHNDKSAFDVVSQVEAGMVPYSHEGNRILAGRFLANIRSHPGAYARKVARNLMHVFVGGFYNGKPRARSADTERDLEILKEKLKMRLGFHPNVMEVETYKEAGEWDAFTADPAAVALMFLLLAATAVGAAFLMISLLGLAVSLRRAPRAPFLMLMASAVVYQWATVSLLQYQPRHMNAVYLFSIPFFLAGFRLLSDRLSRLRSKLSTARSRP